ncbi:MAG TPA: tetratricopeptide repeat protein [Polyangiaceae bacterium]|nr:tetratricopeptide repeat protein [Polyangiaceae bacterium]
MDSGSQLSELSREQLLALARSLGIEHPTEMTRAELQTAIELRRSHDQVKAREVRPTSWLSIARQLLAAVVEQGFNMPDAAALIRGDARLSEPPKPQPPLATVTLAKIYAAQGHASRALSVLSELLKAEPDHPAALELRSQLQQKAAAGETGRRRPGSAKPTEPASGSKPKPDPGPHAPEAIPSAAPMEAVETARAVDQGTNEPTPNAENTLVALCRDSQVLQIAWQISALSRTALSEGGSVEIEWISFTPAVAGPIRKSRQIAVPGPVGSLAAPESSRASLVSAALGLRLGGKFLPLTTLSVVEVGAGPDDPLSVVTARPHAAEAAKELAARYRQLI